MFQLYLLDHTLQNVRRGGGEEGSWINLAAPDGMQQDLAASCVLEVVLEKHLASIHVWVHIPSTLAIALLLTIGVVKKEFEELECATDIMYH